VVFRRERSRLSLSPKRLIATLTAVDQPAFKSPRGHMIPHSGPLNSQGSRHGPRLCQPSQGPVNRYLLNIETRPHACADLSRYVHLNPVRVGRLGLGKSERQRMRVGASLAPEARVVEDRITRLRRYRWSSYRAYVGLGKRPAWLDCEAILELGGGQKGERGRNYREYVEAAVREGREKSPWEQLKDQVVLGGEEFLENLRRHVVGNAREQRGVRRLAVACPMLSEVIASVEKVKGERWGEFRDRHGDSGRDLVLYLGRRRCGLKLQELAGAAGMTDYSTVSIAIRRFEKRLRRSKVEQEQFKQVCQLSNVEM